MIYTVSFQHTHTGPLKRALGNERSEEIWPRQEILTDEIGRNWSARPSACPSITRSRAAVLRV